jgi:hypothetical protein
MLSAALESEADERLEMNHGGKSSCEEIPCAVVANRRTG